MSAASELLRWYDRNRRCLPWRAAPGGCADPYHVWVSEVMLQQTTAGAVGGYYERFLERFPTLRALAAAPEEAVLGVWAGLGYYARARNLHRAAQEIAASGLPRAPEELERLPGIGRYMAAAIAAIAFAIPVVPVDANVTRVLARRHGLATPLPALAREIRLLADALARDPAVAARPGDFAQALFDLGATHCLPRRPDCRCCPWRAGCVARREGISATLPRKAARVPRPHRYGVHFWLRDRMGRVLLRRRPASGPLGGMTELPGTDWGTEPLSRRAALARAPMPAAWKRLGVVQHGFTHFTLEIALYGAAVGKIEAAGFLCPEAALGGEALSSLMRKCCVLAAQNFASFRRLPAGVG